MFQEPIALYPGSDASPGELIVLADFYRTAAHRLLDPAPPVRRPEEQAPGRLLAIHAVELYLNAFLLAVGQPHQWLRGCQHDLRPRVELVKAKGLVLRRRTMAHLVGMSAEREYLTVRYDPRCDAPQLNRLIATLDEVAAKVGLRVPRARRLGEE